MSEELKVRVIKYLPVGEHNRLNAERRTFVSKSCFDTYHDKLRAEGAEILELLEYEVTGTHHDETVTALEAKVARLEAALKAAADDLDDYSPLTGRTFETSQSRAIRQALKETLND